MIRLLLSLLALVSGLAVQVIPAQARLCGECETAARAPAPLSGPADVAVRVVAMALVQHVPMASRRGPALPLPAGFALASRAVLIGIDRTRQ